MGNSKRLKKKRIKERKESTGVVFFGNVSYSFELENIDKDFYSVLEILNEKISNYLDTESKKEWLFPNYSEPKLTNSIQNLKTNKFSDKDVMELCNFLEVIYSNSKYELKNYSRNTRKFVKFITTKVKKISVNTKPY